MAQQIVNAPVSLSFEPSLIVVGETRIAAQNEYNGISLLKGILIILVIIGHILPGGVYGNNWSYWIYSFHMPLFLALVGYLLNEKFIETADRKEIWAKYFKKMIIPWMIAWTTYVCLEWYFYDNFTTPLDVIEFFFLPRMHLWFVAAMFAYVYVLVGLKKIHKSNLSILLVSIIVSIFVVLYFEYWHSWTEWDTTFLGDVYKTYKPHYFVFFMLGYCLKPYKLNRMWGWLGKIALAGVIYWRFVDMSGPKAFYTLDWYLLNILLIILVLPYVKSDLFNQKRILQYPLGIQRTSKFVRYCCYPLMWLGKNSLYIYLWHAIFKYFLFL